MFTSNRVLVLSIIVIAFCVGSCKRVNRSKQVLTQAKLQTISSVITDTLKAQGNLPSEEQLRLLVDDETMTDAWGRRIEYEIIERDDQLHYVLVSRGRDGELDVDSVSEYLDQATVYVDYEFERDVVVVDGVFIQNAGK